MGGVGGGAVNHRTGEGCSCLRDGEGKVEALPKALEGQEGVWREVACGHLAVGFLVAPCWTLALEAADQQVHTCSAVLADSWNTSARTG